MKDTISFDYIKFILSFFVIAIHTGINQQYPYMIHFTNLAVPMFFVISGFLVGNRINSLDKSDADKYLTKNLKRNCHMYVKWTLVYLPLTIYGFVVSEESIPIKVFSVVRGWFLIGENYMSWPLWYLLALIVGILLIRVIYRYVSIEKTFVVSLILYVIGCGIENGLNNPSSNSVAVTSFLKYYHLLFNNTRNGIFVGMFYVMLGVMIHKYYTQLDKRKLMIWLLTLMLFVMHLYDVPYSSILFVPAILFCIMKFNCTLKYSYIMRQLSALIYFTHMYVVFLLKTLCPSVSPFTLFMYTCVGTLTLSYIICLFKTKHVADTVKIVEI